MQKGFNSNEPAMTQRDSLSVCFRDGSAAFMLEQEGVRQVASRANLIGARGRFNDSEWRLEL